MTLDIEAARRRLQDRRNQLLARYQGLIDRVNEELDSREIEGVENAQEQWDARLLTHMSAGDAHQLEAVTAAMMRLEDGAYGACIECGEPIDEERLAVIPEAARCALHEEAFEKEHNQVPVMPGT